MVNIAYLEYCQGDPYFYDLPRTLDETPFDVGELPPGWSTSTTPGWCHVAPPLLRLPVQGWKIHISTTPSHAEKGLHLAAQVCFAQSLAFKFNATRHDLLSRDAKYAARGGSGKFITVYPPDAAALERAVYSLAEVTAGLEGPYVLSDLRWGEGPVHVRYGGFKPMFAEADDGDAVPAIITPEGALVPDPREPRFQPPEWAAIPPFLASTYERYLKDDIELPFTVDEAVHFSNGGGVYIGAVPGRAERVIIKEGRRHAGLDGLLRSGHDRVAHEAAIMRLLAGVPGVPEVVGLVDVWEHRFLAMTRVDGHSLPMDVSLNNPASSSAPSPDVISRYVDRASTIVAGVADIVREAHARGVSIGDIQPQNILVTEHPDVSVIDFEAARTSATERALGTPGFMAIHLTDRFGEDLFALHRIALYLFIPLNDVLSLAPGLAEAHVAFVEDFFGPEPAQLVRDLRVASGEPSHSHHDGFEVAPAGHFGTSQGRRDLARGMLSTVGRFPDRLFPGDIAQFRGDGGLDLWSGAAGAVLALHRAGHLPPDVEQAFLNVLPRTARLKSDTLMTGSLGIATVLDELDRTTDLARWSERLVADGPRLPADSGLRAGLAGLLVGFLALMRHEPGLVDMCGDLADQLVDRVNRAYADPASQASWKAGLFQGWSGAALALVLAADQLGREDFLDPAARAVRLDLSRCIEYEQDGSLQVDDGGRALPYLAHGSVGIAVAGQALLAQRDDDELNAALPRLVRPALSNLYLCGGLTQGRGGMIAALGLIDPQYLPGPRDELISRHVRRLDLYCPVRSDGAFLPGDQNLRFSADYATGAAGLLLALTPSTTRVPWLPGFIPTRLFGPRSTGAVP